MDHPFCQALISPGINEAKMEETIKLLVQMLITQRDIRVLQLHQFKEQNKLRILNEMNQTAEPVQPIPIP